MKSLPNEHLIYLDTVTLVCNDLGDLWSTDLETHPIVAAPNVALQIRGTTSI